MKPNEENIIPILDAINSIIELAGFDVPVHPILILSFNEEKNSCSIISTTIDKEAAMKILKRVARESSQKEI